MGALEFWRAMEGAGKGWSKGIVLGESSKQKRLDREHQDRLTKLQMDATRTNVASRNALLGAQMRSREEIAKRALESSEAVATEQAKRDVSQFEASTAAAEGRERALVSREEKTATREEQRHTERIQAGKLAGKQTGKHIFKISRIVPGETTAGLFGESAAKEDVFVRYDADTVKLEENQNGEWIPANLSPEDEKLIKHPDEWNEYLRRKGSLPQWFIDQLGFDPSKTAAPSSM